jgi:Ca-activated chloride channel family protein
LRKPEARKVYNQARQKGHVAALLDQERPNIFVQKVANIEPGATIEIEITYSETLTYHDGEFEFVYPLVVTPRYKPGTGDSDTDPASNQFRPADPAIPEFRNGENISLTVHLDAGMEVESIESMLHEVKIRERGFNQPQVALANTGNIPNRDFILKYQVTGDEIKHAFFVQEDDRGKFYTDPDAAPMGCSKINRPE